MRKMLAAPFSMVEREGLIVLIGVRRRREGKRVCSVQLLIFQRKRK